MSNVKTKPNDLFLAKTNSAKNFKILVSNGYIREINNILFVYDQELKMWFLSNADNTWVAIPNFVAENNVRIWTLLKTKKTLTGKIKPTHKAMPNTIEIAVEDIDDVMYEISNRNLSFKDTYEVFRERYQLPEYTLGD